MTHDINYEQIFTNAIKSQHRRKIFNNIDLYMDFLLIFAVAFAGCTTR